MFYFLPHFFFFVFVFLFYVVFFYGFFFVCSSVYFFHWDFRLVVLWYTIVKVLCWYLAALFVFVGLLLWINKLETKKKESEIFHALISHKAFAWKQNPESWNMVFFKKSGFISFLVRWHLTSNISTTRRSGQKLQTNLQKHLTHE